MRIILSPIVVTSIIQVQIIQDHASKTQDLWKIHFQPSGIYAWINYQHFALAVTNFY